jgi:hypothetical protein
VKTRVVEDAPRIKPAETGFSLARHVNGELTDYANARVSGGALEPTPPGWKQSSQVTR